MTLGCECKYKDDSHDDHEDVGREFYLMVISITITILIYVFDGDHTYLCISYGIQWFTFLDWILLLDVIDRHEVCRFGWLSE